ncbi:hypothetical protein Lesp02_69100 [Lentzea sp. NBRC 105346]|uniref:tripartite tricarboxylate transporter TctB family protein n=1 Tax=Lentzea sp. NBRC 105346 TaxID=3032205 RepID=UPI0024A13647|nr:tripartite tricarboxylate transporter TctB family protein [Lentzea sp. NBRC 105346]GLZ34723.1 hypothetical protein Lesp02_69100 [Lentzea sp. NBRC 105346]
MTRLAGVLPALLGLLAAWGAIALGLGSVTDPGPGLWPFVTAVLLLGTGIAIAVRPPDDTEPFCRGTAGVLLAVAGLGGYAAVIEHVGFEIPTVVLLAVWLRFLGAESWVVTVVVALLATTAAHLLFIAGLGVPLPHLFGA